MDSKCPIDGTKLGPFNRYDLQDATICRSCAKKLDLVGKHQSLQLANAAHALLTLNIAKDYLNAGKQIDYKVLKSEYKNAVQSGDAPTGREMFKSTIQDIDDRQMESKHTENSSKKPKKSCAICGKAIKFFDPDIKLKDGFLCDDCTKRVGLKYRVADLDWAENHTVSHVRELLNTGKTIDAKALAQKEKEQHTIDKENERKAHKEAELNQVGGVNINPEKPDQSNVVNQQPIVINNVIDTPKEKHHFTGLKCPRCGSTNVQLISTTANIKKTKKSVSLNLNPLHPLTPFNVKEKKVKKRSKGKVAAAVMTGGTSLAATGGTKSNKSHEYHCQNCGKTFITK